MCPRKIPRTIAWFVLSILSSPSYDFVQLICGYPISPLCVIPGCSFYFLRICVCAVSSLWLVPYPLSPYLFHLLFICDYCLFLGWCVLASGVSKLVLHFVIPGLLPGVICAAMEHICTSTNSARQMVLVKNNCQNHINLQKLAIYRQGNKNQSNKNSTSPITKKNINMETTKKEKQDVTPVIGFFLYEEEEIQEVLELTISILGKIVIEKPIHKRSL